MQVCHWQCSKCQSFLIIGLWETVTHTIHLHIYLILKHEGLLNVNLPVKICLFKPMDTSTLLGVGQIESVYTEVVGLIGWVKTTPMNCIHVLFIFLWMTLVYNCKCKLEYMWKWYESGSDTQHYARAWKSIYKCYGRLLGHKTQGGGCPRKMQSSSHITLAFSWRK